MHFDIHECRKAPRYGKIVRDSFISMRDAIEHADEMRAKNGKHYAVVRDRLSCVYTTFDLIHPDYNCQGYAPVYMGRK